MPNWVVKHSRANDTRMAASRKSRSVRGFFLFLAGLVEPARISPSRTTRDHGHLSVAWSAGVAQLVEHYLAKVDVARSNRVSRSTMAPDFFGGFLLTAPSRFLQFALLQHLIETAVP